MSVVLEKVTKRYAHYPVVINVSLEVNDGEFFVLIGPSGSGKSTLLRMIAGLNSVDRGRILVRGREVTHAPPQTRGIGFVFQHYALFQHLTVAQNVEFALRVRQVAKPEQRRRVDELLELVGLAGLGQRRPHQLSGGQQQRVALARALAHRPDVLLLDEPFGALDAKIRVDLRRALRHIQTELGITTIFVTHDQEEAFELADRVGVMNFGHLLEVGQPTELYRHPQSEFTATFLGTANLWVGQQLNGGVRVGDVHFPLQPVTSPLVTELPRVQVLFRPEDVVVASDPEQLNGTPRLGCGTVERSVYSGAYERLRLRLPSMSGMRVIAPPVGFGEEAVVVEALRTLEHARQYPLHLGDRVWVGAQRIHTLPHFGMNFLIVTDGSTPSQAAVALGGQIARLAQARVTLLGYGLQAETVEGWLQDSKKTLGSGQTALDIRTTPEGLDLALTQEVERQAYDLVIASISGLDAAGLVALAERLLHAAGQHHLLLVPGPHPVPTHALICATDGEPGKDDVLFAGRLLRHLGADATLLTVLSAYDDEPARRKRIESFLVYGGRTLLQMGVRPETNLIFGLPRWVIPHEMRTHDLLVLGAPLPDRQGHVSFKGVIGEMITEVTKHPVLVVRSSYGQTQPPAATVDGRIQIIEEIML